MADHDEHTAAPGETGDDADVALVERFWEALGRRDFDAVGAMMTEDGHYIDVPLIGTEEGARGPAEVAARLRLGLEPLERYELHPGPIVARGGTVITEHSEEWWWNTGEHALVRFCSVMEIRDGRVARWWDYLDMSQLLAAAPAWWMEHVMAGYR
ncbi:MAG: nuclear transport factor 2 family protein [Microthrixaceae bacterium]